MNDKDIHPIMKELTKVTKSMPMPVVTEIKLITNRDAYKILISLLTKTAYVLTRMYIEYQIDSVMFTQRHRKRQSLH